MHSKDLNKDFSRKNCQGGRIRTFNTLGGAIVDIWNIGNLNEFVFKIATSHLSVVFHGRKL